jgi:hypothetical protein
MAKRIRVWDSTAILSVVSGVPGGASAGLILNGAEACFNLAEELIDAGNKIIENEKKPGRSTKQAPYGRRKRK